MKKYWIKDLTDKQAIHAPTEEIAEKLCKKFHELGLKWINGCPYSKTDWDTLKEKTCYRPNRGAYGTYGSIDYYIRESFEILTIGNLLDFEEATTFPRRMLVWDNEGEKKKERIVLHKLEGKTRFPIIAVSEGSEEAYHNGDQYEVTSWKFAEELPEPEKMTLEQVRKELGRNIVIVD